MKQSYFFAGLVLLTASLTAPIVSSAQTAHHDHLAYTGKVSQLGSGVFTMAPRRGPSTVNVTTTPQTMYVLMNRIQPTQITIGDRILINGVVDKIGRTVLAERIVDIPASSTPDKFDEGFGKGRDTAKRVIGSVTNVSPKLTVVDSSSTIYTINNGVRVGIFQPSLGTSSNVQNGSMVEVQGREGATSGSIIAKRVLIAVGGNAGRARHFGHRRAG